MYVVMSLPAILLDPNVKHPCAPHKLMVDGQRLALSKRASDSWDANLVSCRIMGSRPNNHIDLHFLRVEPRHPVFPVCGVVIRARVLISRAFEIRQNFLLCMDFLSSLNLFGDLRTHLLNTRIRKRLKRRGRRRKIPVSSSSLILVFVVVAGNDIVDGI